jgi:hypothetical protein
VAGTATTATASTSRPWPIGEDLDLYAVDLRPRMRCAACGEKGATFIISPP